MRFGGHNAVKLGVLREVIHERQDCRAIKQQALALTGVGHIAKLVRGNPQLLRQNLTVSACLVKHIHEVRVFKDILYLAAAQKVFDILGLSAADYPELPAVEDDFSVAIQQKTLRAMIEETAFAVSNNESRPIHTGALFEISDKGLTMVAVDGFRLAVRREPLEKIDGAAFSFVAPGAALNEVKSICADSEDLASVTLGKSHILFEVGATELICRRLEGEFLDYKNAIPRKNPITLIADTKSLIESIDRVSVVISEKQKSPVRCFFDHDKVVLSAKTGNGEAKDVCRISGDGTGLEIGFNNRYLMERCV